MSPRFESIGEDYHRKEGSGRSRRLKIPKAREKKNRAKIPMTPSQWTENFIKIKDGDRGIAADLNFKERPYLRRVYDSPHPNKLLMTSRQTEKSTSVGNILMSTSGLKKMWTSLFVTPSAMQTMVFSRDRIDDIIDISPSLKALTHRSLTMNLLEKEFLTRSKIYLRYAFLSADRIRGITANGLFVDEIQDILQSVMPVIEEVTSHHDNAIRMYSGTPKSFDNTIEQYWQKSSTQAEWCIPCEHHGTPKLPRTWHWNVLGVKNIGLKGPVCDKCGKPLRVDHPYAQWIEMNPGAEYEGYRICRLMVPWFANNPVKWQQIIDAQRRYPTAQFMNEVLALPWDTGTKPITRREIIAACDDRFKMYEHEAVGGVHSIEALSRGNRLFAGIDWGTGDRSYSVLAIGGYVRGDEKFQIFYTRRFDGPLVEPEPQLMEIARFLQKYNIMYAGADYGMGFYPNKKLTSMFGPERIHQFQYVGKTTAKIRFESRLGRYLVFRTPVLSDIFTAIKNQKIMLPCWDDFRSPYADDILSINSEYSEGMKMIKYDKTPGVPDDTFHAITYAFLVSMLEYPRPDIMQPMQEDAFEEDHEATVFMERHGGWDFE